MQNKNFLNENADILKGGKKELVNRVVSEYIEGFNIHDQLTRPILTIYGSARLLPEDKDCQDIEKISMALRKNGWAVVSGGGPGIMKAALDHDLKNTTDTAYFGIDINHERDKSVADKSFTFTSFAVRKHFLRASNAFVVAPGGFGTMDEMFELLTLMQTEKADKVPVVLYNGEYFKGLVDWISSTMIKRGTISPEDLNLFKVCSTPEEAIEFLEKNTKK